MDELFDCARQVAEVMRKEGLDRHSVEVLLDRMTDGLVKQMASKFNRLETEITVKYEKDLSDFGRIIDRVTTVIIDGVTHRFHTETKSGYESVGKALGYEKPVSCSLISHRRFAVASSQQWAAGVFGLQSE